MVTNAEEPEQSPGNREKAIDAAVVARDTAARGLRYAITGDTHGKVRRGLLYALVVLALVLDDTLDVVAGGIGLIAVLLLAFTDNVMEVNGG